MQKEENRAEQWVQAGTEPPELGTGLCAPIMTAPGQDGAQKGDMAQSMLLKSRPVLTAHSQGLVLWFLQVSTDRVLVPGELSFSAALCGAFG